MKFVRNDHLLLHCLVAGILWSWIFRAFGICWILFGNIADMLFSRWNVLGQHSSDTWNLIPLCLIWIVWKERNRLMFEDVSSFDSQLLDCFALTLFYWSRAWGFTISSTVIDFISPLYLLHDDVIIWCYSVHALCTLWIILLIISLPLPKKKNCQEWKN